jgi:2-polyprenyl-3-methyl-5-hydroxy-6-metoxy-1,4-benzoquinol methylase
MNLTCPCGTERQLPEAKEPRIDWCPACGTGATWPQPARDIHGDGLFEDESSVYGGDRLASESQWMHEATTRLAWVEHVVGRNARLLEIGSATGEFVAAAERAGHSVVGLEPSGWAARSAKRLTDAVRHSDLTAWRAENPNERFDAVVMFHVLEHVANPHDLLGEVAEVVHPTGMLVLEVPNGASPAAHEQGVNWWWARPEDHYFHYTSEGLAELLSATGWRAGAMTQTRVNVYGKRSRLRRVAGDAARRLLGRSHPRDLLRATATRQATRAT